MYKESLVEKALFWAVVIIAIATIGALAMSGGLDVSALWDNAFELYVALS